MVWIGVEPGIYESWMECQSQVKGFANAKYKAYNSRQEAELALKSGPESSTNGKRTTKSKNDKANHQEEMFEKPGIVTPSISVDAGCIGNPGLMEYQGVRTDNGERIFYQGPFLLATNNIGEFLAIVHALAFLKKRKDENTPVYTDSRTAMRWVRNGKAKTTLPRNDDTSKLFELIERAEKWLKANNFKNELLKWDTDNWGEIPADFGRK